VLTQSTICRRINIFLLACPDRLQTLKSILHAHPPCVYVLFVGHPAHYKCYSHPSPQHPLPRHCCGSWPRNLGLALCCCVYQATCAGQSSQSCVGAVPRASCYAGECLNADLGCSGYTRGLHANNPSFRAPALNSRRRESKTGFHAQAFKLYERPCTAESVQHPN